MTENTIRLSEQRRESKAGEEKELGHAMTALKAIYGTEIKPKGKKRPGTKKRKKKRINKKSGKEEIVELEEFVYDWDTCVCGMNHPPIPDFEPPHGKRCIYYWLIELTELKKILQTNMGPVSDKLVERTFKEIDTDESGSLDFGEVLSMVDTLVQRRENKLPEKVQKDYSKVCTIQ